MKLTDLTKKIAADTGLPATKVKAVIDSLNDNAERALAVGDEVPLASLGRLTVQTRAARTGRNPQTGATVEIPAKQVVKFKVNSGLTKALN